MTIAMEKAIRFIACIQIIANWGLKNGDLRKISNHSHPQIYHEPQKLGVMTLIFLILPGLLYKYNGFLGFGVSGAQHNPCNNAEEVNEVRQIKDTQRNGHQVPQDPHFGRRLGAAARVFRWAKEYTAQVSQVWVFFKPNALIG